MINKEIIISGTDNSRISFWCASTNDGDKQLKECAITVVQEDNQFDFDLNLEELEELIDYLDEMKDFIKEYNDKN